MDDPLKDRKMDEIFHSNRKMSILLNLSKVLHQVVECKNKMLLRESTFQGDQSGIKYFHPRNLSRKVDRADLTCDVIKKVAPFVLSKLNTRR